MLEGIGIDWERREICVGDEVSFGEKKTKGTVLELIPDPKRNLPRGKPRGFRKKATRLPCRLTGCKNC